MLFNLRNYITIIIIIIKLDEVICYVRKEGNEKLCKIVQKNKSVQKSTYVYNKYNIRDTKVFINVMKSSEFVRTKERK